MVNLKILKEQTADRGERFAKTFARARTDMVKISAIGERQMIKFLQELRVEINERVQSFVVNPRQPFLSQIIPQIEEEIRTAVAGFAERATVETVARMQDAFGVGSRVTANAFRDAGVNLAFPSVSPELLATLSAATADILTDVSSSLADKIAASIRTSAIGLEPSSTTMLRVGSLIKTSKEFIDGKRRRIGFAFQAEEIVRTETGRIYSNAQQAAAEQIAVTIPKLQKRWLTVGGGRVRQGHMEAQRRYEPGGERGPIPVNQSYRVQDFSRIGRSRFMTLGGRVSPPQGVTGLRVIRKDFTRRGRVITDRMLFPRDPSATPGNVVNCLLPDNEQISGEFILGLKAFYSGPAFVIETRRGARLSLTANHPVITSLGWKPAKDILEGDYLLRDNSKIRRAAFDRIRNQDNKNIPTFPEKIFNALGAKGAIKTITTAAGYFDGDSDWMQNGNIQIVSPNTELLQDLDFLPTDSSCQRIFKGASVGQSLKSCSSHLRNLCSTSLSSSASSPSSATSFLNSCSPSTNLRHSPSFVHSFGFRTKWDSAFLECGNQGSPRDSEFLSELLHRSAGQILFDYVIKIEQIHFKGHVYDFQSTSGTMRCQDIYISNCRCISLEVVPEIDEAVDKAKGVIQSA